jgi:hypothetical protein
MNHIFAIRPKSRKQLMGSLAPNRLTEAACES